MGGEWSITNPDGDDQLLILYNDGLLECSKASKGVFNSKVKVTLCYVVECPLSHVLDNVNNANDNGSRVVYLDGLQMSTRLPKTSRRQYKSEAQNGREWRFAKISDLRSFQIQLQRLETKVTNGKQFIKDANQKAKSGEERDPDHVDVRTWTNEDPTQWWINEVRTRQMLVHRW